MDELMRQRVALLDLLVGRNFRSHAEAALAQALGFESEGLDYMADERFAQAAHIEWIASLTEAGRIAFGGRLNRCGWQPKVEEE